MEHCKRGSGKGTQEFLKNGTQRINGREEHLYFFIEFDLVPIILSAFLWTATWAVSRTVFMWLLMPGSFWGCLQGVQSANRLLVKDSHWWVCISQFQEVSVAGCVRLRSLACGKLECGHSDRRLACFPELKLVPFVGSALEEGSFRKQSQKELRTQSCVHEGLTHSGFLLQHVTLRPPNAWGVLQVTDSLQWGTLYLSNFLLSPGMAWVTG